MYVRRASRSIDSQITASKRRPGCSASVRRSVRPGALPDVLAALETYVRARMGSVFEGSA
jgi:hypothetical protein